MITAFSSTAHMATPVRAAPISSFVWRVPSTKMPSRLPLRSTARALVIVSRSALPRSTGNAPVCGMTRRSTGTRHSSIFAM